MKSYYRLQQRRSDFNLDSLIYDNNTNCIKFHITVSVIIINIMITINIIMNTIIRAILICKYHDN